jgi:hypothetical protein
VISSIALAVAVVLFLLGAIVMLTTRRLRSNNQFELGSVSQQWLTGHRGDER